MEELKVQVEKSVLFLLFVIPLVPPSFKPSYLYFLINSLVFVLGADAGFIGEGKKETTAVAIMTAAAHPPPPLVISELNALQEEGGAESDMIVEVADDHDEKNGIEGEEEDVGGVLSEEELFTRAEAFIDSFYKQLKMQIKEGGV